MRSEGTQGGSDVLLRKQIKTLLLNLMQYIATTALGENISKTNTYLF